MHPVLLFRCFGFVFGALRIAPGVGWMGSFAWPLIPSWMEPRMPAEDMLGRPSHGDFYCSKKAADEETSDMPEGVRHGEGGAARPGWGGRRAKKGLCVSRPSARNGIRTSLGRKTKKIRYVG